MRNFKKLYVIAILSLAAFYAVGQDFPEIKAETNIEGVTVFLKSALIQRSSQTDIQSGDQEIIFESLSPFLDSRSLNVKADGDFTILSVNHRLNYLEVPSIPVDNEVILNRIDSLDGIIETSLAKLSVLKNKEDFLKTNQKLSSEQASLNNLKATLTFYEEEFSKIRAIEISEKALVENLRKQKERLSKQIAAPSQEDPIAVSEVVVRVNSKQKTQGEFKISYLVTNAGWYPKYDVRVENIEEPLYLTYKAMAYQNTGVDWDNVSLKFSNGNPTESGVAPKLEKWNLNYTRNTVNIKDRYLQQNFSKVSGIVVDEDNSPLIGANVLVKGTSIGTITDIDGKYSLTLPFGAEYLEVSYVGFNSITKAITSSYMNVTLEESDALLDEVVVTAYSKRGVAAGIGSRSKKEVAIAKTIMTTTIENQTTVEFEVEEPYSIKSKSPPISIELKKHEINSNYKYICIPKLNTDAFLIAQIMDWDQYNLLEGEANLYFEDTYVGQTILNARDLVDTLNISLGQDKSIVVGRTKVKDYSKKRILGSKKVESRAFEILVRNKKSSVIDISIYDQLPIAAISDISVVSNELSSGILDEAIGEITWTFKLQPQSQEKVIFSYEVKYPKDELVKLE